MARSAQNRTRPRARFLPRRATICGVKTRHRVPCESIAASALSLFFTPAEWFYAGNDDAPGDEAEQRDAAGDGEGPEEFARALHHEAGDQRTHHARNIADAVLYTHPVAGGARACENLRDGIDV